MSLDSTISDLPRQIWETRYRSGGAGRTAEHSIEDSWRRIARALADALPILVRAPSDRRLPRPERIRGVRTHSRATGFWRICTAMGSPRASSPTTLAKATSLSATGCWRARSETTADAHR
jgi:hypothetical protein